MRAKELTFLNLVGSMLIIVLVLMRNYDFVTHLAFILTIWLLTANWAYGLMADMYEEEEE